MKPIRVTRRMLEKAVKAVLGPTGRVWKGKDMWSIGQDLRPGRIVHGSGPTMPEAWASAFLDPDAIKAEAQRIDALRSFSQTQPSDLTTGQQGPSDAIPEGVQP